jgi:hypothetical protein
MKIIKDFPHKFYFYGSSDSLDTDVFIQVDRIINTIYEKIKIRFQFRLEHEHDYY